jgi:hypothetical protein
VKNLKKVTSIFLVLVLMMGVYGCGFNKPSNVVKGYFQELKNGEKADLAKLAKSIDATEENKNSGFSNFITGKKDAGEDKNDSEQIKKQLFETISKVTCKVNSEQIDGENAKVNVTVNGPNIQDLMKQYMQKVFSDAMSQAFASNKMTDEEKKKHDQEIIDECIKNVKYEDRTGDISLKKSKDGWKITADDSLMKLVMGIDSTFLSNFK